MKIEIQFPASRDANALDMMGSAAILSDKVIMPRQALVLRGCSSDHPRRTCPLVWEDLYTYGFEMLTSRNDLVRGAKTPTPL